MGQTSQLTISFALGLFLTGCGTMKVTEDRTRSATTYKHTATSNNVVVAVHPVTDSKEMKQWFRTDLLAKGILPVLVVVENRDAARSFLLSKDRVMFANDDEESTASSKRGKVASEDTGQALAVAGAFASSGALLAGLKLMSDAQVIEHNLADKELYTRTLGPGKEAHGFVYFQFQKGGKLSGKYRVVVLLVETATGDVTAFDFKMH